ncbi:helix-turn-helix domain-containing protein [Carnobacterium sp.]|uniref:helix-turn-helix domain-containing protein n=1 Tax=Carnobacterium sp. TaxID=48221 RepID=UPI002FC7C792
MTNQLNENDQMVLSLAGNLKRLRKANKLSLEGLADQTGVSKLTINKIEQGKTNPTIGILWKIANGLGVTLMELLESEEVVLLRGDENFTIFSDDNQWALAPLVTNLNKSETFRARLAPKSRYTPESHPNGSKEVITVLEGELTLIVGGTTYLLKKSDTIRFAANLPHVYQNNSDQPVELHLTMTSDY